MKRFLVMIMLFAAAACFRNVPARSDQPATTLRVENQAFLDMNIYLLRGSETVRLGTATGNSTTTLTIPPRVIFGPTPLRFQARPIGANRQPVSEEITVSEGEEVTIIIPPQ